MFADRWLHGLIQALLVSMAPCATTVTRMGRTIPGMVALGPALCVLAATGVGCLDLKVTSTGDAGAGGADTDGGSACTVPTDCSGDDTLCGRRICVAGKCGREPLQPVGPIASQRYGDCSQIFCDANGNIDLMLDSGDVYDDARECTQDVCQLGVPKQLAIAVGTICAEGICDGAGICVQCVDNNQCGADICYMARCVPTTCMDGQKNGAESAIDCGGVCKPCNDGIACMAGGDCGSGKCINSICQPPACDDGIRNGGESDFDCGGGCKGCPVGFSCAMHSDCDSNVCMQGICLPPSCNDAVINGNEAGVDCGGSCSPCPT